MTENSNQQVVIRTDTDLKIFLAKNYMAQIKNFFGNEQKAMKFLSSVMASVQKTPELLNCQPTTLINSFMTMAQLGLMPSDVSGEAYVLPYAGKAQFQLGYQGIVTLFYLAVGQTLRGELIRKNDKFSYTNGVISHDIDITKSNDERGEIIAVYAVGKVGNEEIAKAMNIKDVPKYKDFSKAKDSKYSPWNSGLDPENWMLKKTVLKQLAKMLPKNETINTAIAEDNEESIVSKAEGLVDESNLQMKNFLNDGKKNKDTSSSEDNKAPGDQK